MRLGVLKRMALLLAPRYAANAKTPAGVLSVYCRRRTCTRGRLRAARDGEVPVSCYQCQGPKGCLG
jgi:hypothetical protein